VFADHVEQSKWVSFTATMSDPTLLRVVRDLTGNAPGEGGLSRSRNRVGSPRSSSRISPISWGNPTT